MKKKLLLLLGATMIFGCLAACGKKDEKKEDNTTVESAEEGRGDVIEDTDLAIFDNNVFSFTYNPEHFTVFESEDGVTVSYTNEEVQIAGSNVIMFSKVENTDAMQVVKSSMELYGASDDEMVENYLGGDDVTGYSYSTGILQAEGSELKTCDTYYSVPCGTDVILINSLRTYGNDMDLENAIDEEFGEIIVSFKLN